jgi:hypothetical protein
VYFNVIKRKKSRQSSSKLTQASGSAPPLLCAPCACACVAGAPAPAAPAPPHSTRRASSYMCRGDRHPTASHGAMLLAKVLPQAAAYLSAGAGPVLAVPEGLPGLLPPRARPRKVRSCLSASVSPALAWRGPSSHPGCSKTSEWHRQRQPECSPIHACDSQLRGGLGRCSLA